MKPFRWSSGKNDLLMSERGVSFEQITVAIESGSLLDVLSHRNQTRYPNQSDEKRGQREAWSQFEPGP